MREPWIRFTFDYVDPGSYVAAALLDRWARRRPSPPHLTWEPLELRTPRAEPIDPADAGWDTLVGAMAEIAESEEIPFTPPDRIPWTRKAHELGFHAREKGCFESVHAALFEAHFAAGRDISRVDVLVELAGEQGMDPAEVRTVLGVDRFAASVEEARREALERGIRGVPTLESHTGTLEGLRRSDELYAFLEKLAPGPAGR